MPRARHLAQVLAQHEFQEALKNYRDLRFLARNLEEWREKLTVFEDMLATRRKAFADRLPLVRERQQQIDVEALVKRREALVAEVAAGEAAGDGVAFADAKQLDLLARMKEMRRIVDAPNADEEASSSATGFASSPASSPGRSRRTRSAASGTPRSSSSGWRASSARPSATPMRCRRRNARSRSASIASRAASPPWIRNCR